MAKDITEIIERDVAEPAWRQLAAILRRRIHAGRYQPGHAIPSEKQCEAEFGISRGTCRKAIAVLRGEGLVITVPGRGSYVASEADLRRRRDQALKTSGPDPDMTR
jgi:GntR family transcriptional regulator